MNVIRSVTLAVVAFGVAVATPMGIAAAQQARPVQAVETNNLQTAPVAAGGLAVSERSDTDWQAQLMSAQQSMSVEQERRQAEAEAQAQAKAKAAQDAKAKAAQATTPQAPAAPAVQVPAGSVQEIIAAAFAPYGSDAVTWGLRVARCESGYNPHAYNGAGYYGLFQFAMSTFVNNSGRAGFGYTSDDIWDPAANSRVAAYMYSQGQQGQWGCR